MKKLWIKNNPYVNNALGMVRPHWDKLVRSLKSGIICFVMFFVNILDVFARVLFIIAISVCALIESIFQLLMIYGEKATRPIIPTWESFISMGHYITFKALFKEGTLE